jgi:hypothetical protein
MKGDRLSPAQARAELEHLHQLRQVEFALEILDPNPNWNLLFELHWQLVALERTLRRKGKRS